jgi:hypothetical protein
MMMMITMMITTYSNQTITQMRIEKDNSFDYLLLVKKIINNVNIIQKKKLFGTLVQRLNAPFQISKGIGLKIFIILILLKKVHEIWLATV